MTDVTPEGIEVPGGYLDPIPQPEEHPDEKPSNMDDNGVLHFGIVLPRKEDPDVCGGCGALWPCDGAVLLGLVTLPEEDPADVPKHAAPE